MIKKIISILLLLFLFIPMIAHADKSPTSQDVRDALNKIITTDKEYKDKKEDSERSKKFSEAVSQLIFFIIFLLFQIRYIILAVIILIFLIFLIMILKDAFPYFKTSKESRRNPAAAERDQKEEIESYGRLYEKALDYAKKGSFNLAVVFLQKSAIEILRKTAITVKTKTLTNNDIKKLIADALMYKPFCILTTAAEKAGFSSSVMADNDYQPVLNEFKNSFLDNK